MNEQQHPGQTTPCLEAGQLMAWHDGVLPQPEAAAVQAHLAVCPRCAAQDRAVLRDRQQVFALLTSLDPLPAAQAEPAVALARFQQRLHAQHARALRHDSNGSIDPEPFPLSEPERRWTTHRLAYSSTYRHRLGAVAQTLLVAMLVAALLATILLLRETRAPSAGGTNHSPTLMLSPTVTFFGSAIQVTLTHFPPSTSVVLTHDREEPLHLANGSSIISVSPDGSASVEIHIDSSWGTGSHVIVAEDLKTNATVSATLQIASSASQAYALFVATNGIMDGFDAQHTHFNPFEQVLSPTTVGGLTQKWSYDMGSSVSGSPTVAGGVVYIGCVCGNVYAFDAVTGKKKWAYPTEGSQVADEPAVVGGVVYIGTIESHTLYALDAATGKKKWAYQTGGPIGSSPTVVGGVIYVGSEDNTLYALDAATGAKQWAYRTGDTIDTSPTVAGGVVYVGSNDNTLYALDAATGAKQWAYRTANGAFSPVVAGGVVYFGDEDGYVYALDAATGARQWVYKTGGPVDTSPAVAGGVVYVGSRDGYVYALDAATGAKQWMTPEKMSTDPVLAGGLLYFGTFDGYVCALDVTTGVVKWFYWDRSTVDSSPAVADGMVYYGSQNGPLYAFHLRGT